MKKRLIARLSGTKTCDTFGFKSVLRKHSGELGRQRIDGERRTHSNQRYKITVGTYGSRKGRHGAQLLDRFLCFGAGRCQVATSGGSTVEKVQGHVQTLRLKSVRLTIGQKKDTASHSQRTHSPALVVVFDQSFVQEGKRSCADLRRIHELDWIFSINFLGNPNYHLLAHFCPVLANPLPVETSHVPQVPGRTTWRTGGETAWTRRRPSIPNTRKRATAGSR